MISIAVDAMSGENDPAAAVAASLRMAREHSDMHFFLAGRRAALEPLTADAPPNIGIEDAAEVVAMREPPKRAIRRRGTSMRRAMELVAENRAQAVVSAGNTGALLGVGLLVAGKIAGVPRPAIASFMPNTNLDGGCCMLDLGANVECSAEMLQQFARMGAALATAVRGVVAPRVGLLNVGEEHFKGGEVLRAAAARLREMKDINFAGNVEGFDIYLGKCDVIVCDGFTGNVALKTSEGLARMISGMIRGAFRRDALSTVCGALASPVLSRLRRDMDARRSNGACFFGVGGLVVKSHGKADATAFSSALNSAARAARRDVVGVIRAMPRTDFAA
ncbi:MAG: phosphate acyltransferase PlsX [Gammaproteobacteria bacterium]